jgi:hypothetical protein
VPGSSSRAARTLSSRFLSRETLARIVPGQTTHEEVLALCGRDTLEEQEVEIAFEGGVVQDVEVRVRRARLPHPDAL